MSKWKYILGMWYSELTNTLYAVIRDNKWNIIEKKDVTDRVINVVNEVYIDRINELINKNKWHNKSYVDRELNVIR